MVTFMVTAVKLDESSLKTSYYVKYKLTAVSFTCTQLLLYCYYRVPTHLENFWNFYVRPGIFGMISRFTLVFTL